LDLFISPARSEPFGLSIVEAMAAGVPVIATVSEGAREIIADQETGRLVPIGHTQLIATAIIEMLNDEAERGRRGEDAGFAARRRFSVERMVDETERLYAEALT